MNLDFKTAEINSVKAYLSENLNKLNDNDANFASSLVASAKTSERQAHWIRILAERTLPRKAAAIVDGLGALNELFHNASRRAKFPKILIKTEQGDLRLSLAGANSSNPGTINVTTPGSFENRTWFGRIDHNGRFIASQKAANRPDIGAALKCFAENPESAAGAYGRETGACCFCARELTDSRSVTLGYGPICAEKFGLAY